MHVCRFNLRVLECRIAAMLLAHLLPAPLGTVGAPAQALVWQQVTILKQVEQQLLQYAAANSSSSGAVPAGLLVWAVQQLLPEATYTLQQVRALWSQGVTWMPSTGISFLAGCRQWQ